MPKFTKYDLVAVREKYRKGERLSASEVKLLNSVNADDGASHRAAR